jgi:hypothetical protein
VFGVTFSEILVWVITIHEIKVSSTHHTPFPHYYLWGNKQTRKENRVLREKIRNADTTSN